jgi:hypothetical protein
MINENSILTDLKAELDSLTKGLATLEYCFKECSRIGFKKEYSFDELDKWEAFTARFNRLSDITTQKIFNSIMILMKGSTGSLIDKANFESLIESVVQVDV